MFYRRTGPLIACVSILLIGFASSLAAQNVPLQNWSAPASYTPSHPSGMKSLLTDVGNPSAFIPITPCRLADTRGFGFTGQAGPPALTAGVPRTFQIAGTVPGVTTQCGIPTDAVAVSFNFAVVNIGANGNLVIYPKGGTTPTVSSLNYQVGFAALSNAAIIPLGGPSPFGITINVNGSGTVDVIIDVNGYYGPSPNSNRGFAINSGTARGGVFHTTGGLEAVDAFCDTPSMNCWAFYGSALTGDYAIVASGGRGSSLSASDDTYAGVHGTWVGTAATTNYGVLGDTVATGNCAAGVKGIGNGDVACGHTSTIGVYGVNLNGIWGVLGVSQLRGTQGSRVNASGVGQTFGVLGYAGNSGVHSFNDITAAGVKSFVEPHPTDATKQINFIAAEANEPLTMFRGRGRFVNGVAVLRVPEEFQFVTEPDSLSIQITPIGDTANVAVTHIGLDGISVKASRNVEFFYLVHGRRAGFENRTAIEENTLYVPDSPYERLPNYPMHIQQRLIANGIYNQDGTVNMKTAEAQGWAAKWRDNEKAAEAANEARKRLLHKDDHTTQE